MYLVQPVGLIYISILGILDLLWCISHKVICLHASEQIAHAPLGTTLRPTDLIEADTAKTTVTFPSEVPGLKPCLNTRYVRDLWLGNTHGNTHE